MSRTLNEKQGIFWLEQIDIISPCHLFRHLQRTDVEVSDEQKELLNLQIPHAVKRFVPMVEFFTQLEVGSVVFFSHQLHFCGTPNPGHFIILIHIESKFVP